MTLFDRLIARIAYVHAQRTYARFARALRSPTAAQECALQRALAVVRGSAYARRFGLDAVRNRDDLRRAAPLATYEDLRPYIERVMEGDVAALLTPKQRPIMFATSSGTTAKPKFIPVTPAFEADYRRGWNTFGLKLLADHPTAILRAILQSSGRMDESRTAGGTPCGAITGLMARTQKRIVRRYYVGCPEMAYIVDVRARQYTLMRFGLTRDVAFAITANPATLIQLARTADEESERIIRDVRDGTLSRDLINDEPLRRRLSARLKPAPDRARELEALRRQTGALRPRDYWKIEFLACWTGGSMGHYLDRLQSWWGQRPVRDIGLLASEGRVSVPLSDDIPSGVLDVTAACFEFIPVEQAETAAPETILPEALEEGREYVVLLTNTAGLVRYRLDDVIRVNGRVSETPVIEFLHRAGCVASLAGEKLTENQVVSAVRSVQQVIGLEQLEFVCAPCWGDPPYYQITLSVQPTAELSGSLDTALSAQNPEYASRRKSFRLGALKLKFAPADEFAQMDRRLIATRRSTTEQYKRPCLILDGADGGFISTKRPSY